MTLNTITYNGVEKSLADWGISRFERHQSNQGSDNITFDLQNPADAAEPFPFGAQITLRIGRIPSAVNPISPFSPPSVAQIPSLTYSGGNVFFVGWRTDDNRTADSDNEKLRYKFGGPWDYFLERLVFQKLFLMWNGSENIADWRSQVILGMSLTKLTGPTDSIPDSVATTRLSLSQQIREIVNYCINATIAEFGSAQFQFDPLTMNVAGVYPLLADPGPLCEIPDYVPGLGTGLSGNGLEAGQTTLPLQAPLDAVQDVTCGECLRRELRWIGGVGSPVAWFDYTQTPPALHISTRDQLPAISVAAFPAKAITITRRDDLVPPAICLKFRVTNTETVGGVTVSLVQVFDDIACSAGGTNAVTGVTDSSLLPYRQYFGAQVTTLNFEGVSTQSASINSVALDLGDPSSDPTALACWQAISPDFENYTDLKLVTGSVTVVDVTGAPVDTTPYGYVLLSGGVANWMVNPGPGGGPGAAIKVRVSGTFSFTNADGKVCLGQTINADAILANLPTGGYSSVDSLGETIPWGLASYIYNIEKIPQYEGSYVIQEAEVTDQCPMGNNLNLTGSLAEWGTMNACVQSIDYDLDAGTTRLTFGPAGHLGAKDLVERLRLNRPPRSLYLIGYDMTDQAESD